MKWNDISAVEGAPTCCVVFLIDSVNGGG